MSVFPSSRPTFPASQPQEAYLTEDNSPVSTWRTVLDYTAGSGFLHELRGVIDVSGGGNQVANVDFRVTIDGNASILELSSTQLENVLEDDGDADYYRLITFGLLRFNNSLKVEIMTPNSGSIRGKATYSTDI